MRGMQADSASVNKIAAPEGTLTAMLAAQPADATAIVYEGERWTFGALQELSRKAAGGLARLGIGPGDRVAIWLPNCVAYAATMLGCAQLGAVAVAVNTRYRSVEVEDIVGRGRCKALVFWPGFKSIDFAGILKAVDPKALTTLETLVVYDEGGDAPGDVGIPGIATVRYEDVMSAPPLADCHGTPDSPCNMFTTSGTTKKPKFVMHKQSVVVHHAREVVRGFGYGAPDAVMLQTVPMCGVFGFCQFLAGLAAGRPNVLMPVFDAEGAVDLIREHGVTHTVGGDDMADRMIAAADASGKPMSTLRRFGYARFNAALTDIVERADAHGFTMCAVYGSSEVQALFSVQRADAPAEQRKLGGGIPVSADAEIRARDRETGRILPHGEPGELEMRAPSLMIGYDGNPEATAEAMTEDGYFRTGDLGYTTEREGFVYLSRMGDVLRLGGFLVNPAEIEDHLVHHPAVDGAQVVGVEKHPGTVAVGFVMLKPGAETDEAALKAHCKAGLASFKQPVRVFIVDAFPVTQSANGTKIQRAKLREMAAERLAEA